MKNGTNEVRQRSMVATEQNCSWVVGKDDLCGGNCRFAIAIEFIKGSFRICIKPINCRLEVFAPVLTLKEIEH